MNMDRHSARGFTGRDLWSWPPETVKFAVSEQTTQSVVYVVSLE